MINGMRHGIQKHLVWFLQEKPKDPKIRALSSVPSKSLVEFLHFCSFWKEGYIVLNSIQSFSIAAMDGSDLLLLRMERCEQQILSQHFLIRETDFAKQSCLIVKQRIAPQLKGCRHVEITQKDLALFVACETLEEGARGT